MSALGGKADELDGSLRRQQVEEAIVSWPPGQKYDLL